MATKKYELLILPRDKQNSICSGCIKTRIPIANVPKNISLAITRFSDNGQPTITSNYCSVCRSDFLKKELVNEIYQDCHKSGEHRKYKDYKREEKV